MVNTLDFQSRDEGFEPPTGHNTTRKGKNMEDDYTALEKAFAIFRKYPHSHFISPQHDEIHAGPDPDSVTEEDKALLKELGFNDYGEGSFHKFM